MGLQSNSIRAGQRGRVQAFETLPGDVRSQAGWRHVASMLDCTIFPDEKKHSTGVFAACVFETHLVFCAVGEKQRETLVSSLSYHSVSREVWLFVTRVAAWCVRGASKNTCPYHKNAHRDVEG